MTKKKKGLQGLKRDANAPRDSLAPIEPKRGKLPPHAEDLCFELAGRIGIGDILVAEKTLCLEAMKKTEARFRHEFDKPYTLAIRDVSRVDEANLILRRCFLWALANDVLVDRVRPALRSMGVERQEEIFSRIKKQLLPSESDTDPGAYFDPLCWPYDGVGANLERLDEALACLGLFRVMMRFQERGLARRDLRPREIASIISAARERLKCKRVLRPAPEAEDDRPGRRRRRALLGDEFG